MKKLRLQIQVIGMVCIICLCASFSSCKKFLEEKPDRSLTVPKTLNELEGLFNDAQRMNIDLTPSYGESSSDDYFLLDATYNTLSTSLKDVYTWSLREYNFKNDWAANYLPVYNANFALESLDKIERNPANEQQWNLIKGYALFWRAYCFLNLAWTYSKAYDSSSANQDLGIALRLASDFNLPSHRASVQETYKQILSDAKEASLFLPNSSTHVFFPSKAASYGLTARAYLSMRNYDSAYKYSQLCLNLRSDLLDYNDLPLTSSVPFPRLDNPETIFYTEMNTYNVNHYSFYGFIDSTLYALYDNNDLRKTGFFNLNGEYYRFKGAYSGNSILLFTGIATDEVLFINAEANARRGNITDAMNDLNILLKKRWDNTVPYIPATAANKEEAIAKIVMERRKELLMRGIRWSDIKRLNKEDWNITPKRVIEGQVYSLPPNDNRYALPLPSDIINLTGMPQNP